MKILQCFFQFVLIDNVPKEKEKLTSFLTWLSETFLSFWYVACWNLKYNLLSVLFFCHVSIIVRSLPTDHSVPQSGATKVLVFPKNN